MAVLADLPDLLCIWSDAGRAASALAAVRRRVRPLENQVRGGNLGDHSPQGLVLSWPSRTSIVNHPAETSITLAGSLVFPLV
jgi:hypothetical protein